MKKREYRQSNSQMADDKDQQIVQLKLALQAQITRNSLIHSRLVTTLDSLDLQQLTHQDEISELKKSRDHLKARLTRYTKVVEATESEKDDMRDAVLQLVQKVESAKNYAALPCNHITLSTPVDELYPSNTRLNTPGFPALSRSKGKEKDPDIGFDLIGYAPSLIASLRRERDNERKAHGQTRSELEARIWALEAMVSRRESELEFLIAQPNGEQDTNKNEPGPSMIPLNQHLEQEVISMLDGIVLRNRKLDSEIRSLAKKLEIAKNRTTVGGRPRGNSSPRSSSYNISSASRRNDVGTNPPPSLNKYHLSELENELKDLDDKITSFAAERKAIQQDLGMLPKPEYAEIAIGTDAEHDDSGNTNERRHWEELTSRLESITNERDRLLEENSRLRAELENTRSQIRAENEDTIMGRDSPFAPRDGNPLQTQPTHSFSPETFTSQPVPTGNLLDGDLSEEEQSMELATPLVPLISLEEMSNPQQPLSPNPFFNPPPRHRPHPISDHDSVDPASIRLPDSPEDENDASEGEREQDTEWDLDLSNAAQLDIARFRSPPMPSPAPSGSSLPGSPAISPTLTLASIHGIGQALSPSMIGSTRHTDPASNIRSTSHYRSISAPLPALQESPIIKEGVQRRKAKSIPRVTGKKSSRRERDDGRSWASSSASVSGVVRNGGGSSASPNAVVGVSGGASPGASHMDMLLDGFGSDGHSVERENYEDI